VDETGAAALAALARGEVLAWCINICAPNWWSARSWGDLYFARAIQQALARHGRPSAIHVMDQWEASRDERFGVVLHLKGLSTYEPNPAQVNLLWNISHPDKLTTEECERSDLVLVASERFAAELRERCSMPVHVLEQATDPAVFFPDAEETHAHELVFVGNSRKVMRRVVADLLPTGHDLAVWGGDWDGLIEARHIKGTHLPNDEVRRAYSSAAIVLNDHWDDMCEHGFASNRIYDAVACGALVVSDRLDGLEERFGGAVVTYEGRDELATVVEHFLAHPEERAARGAAGREIVLAQHTFAHRVDELLAHADAALAAAAA
jgi:spore maturation protein CgeB